MNANEKALLTELCKFISPNRNRIERLIKAGADSPALLGNLIINGVAGIAYGVLGNNGLLHLTNSEFRESLEKEYTVNEKITADFTGCVNYISELLNSSELPYAFLGDAYLYKIYPNGYKVPRCIELLVRKEDIGRISAKLKLAGFKKGFVENGIPNEKRFDDTAKDNTIFSEYPVFYKEIKLPYIKYLYVKPVFSLEDDKGNEQNINAMLSKSYISAIKGTNIRTLDMSDFILGMCAEIYKDAHDMRKIISGSDMLLYRFTDFYAVSSDMTEESAGDLINRAEESNKICELAFCLTATTEFFGVRNRAFDNFLDYLGQYSDQADVLNIIYDNTSRKKYRYTESNMVKRFFARSRYKLLVEETEASDE